MTFLSPDSRKLLQQGDQFRGAVVHAAKATLRDLWVPAVVTLVGLVVAVLSVGAVTFEAAWAGAFVAFVGIVPLYFLVSLVEFLSAAYSRPQHPGSAGSQTGNVDETTSDSN